MFLKVKHCENKQHVKFMEIFKKESLGFLAILKLYY